MKKLLSILLAGMMLAGCGQATDLITGELHDFGGGSELPPHSAAFWLMER